MDEAGHAYADLEAGWEAYASSRPVMMVPRLPRDQNGPGQFIAQLRYPMPEELAVSFSRCLQLLAHALDSLAAAGTPAEGPMGQEIRRLGAATEPLLWLGVSVVVNAHPHLHFSTRIRDAEPVATVPLADFQAAIALNPQIAAALRVGLAAAVSGKDAKDLARSALDYTELLCHGHPHGRTHSLLPEVHDGAEAEGHDATADGPVRTPEATSSGAGRPVGRLQGPAPGPSRRSDPGPTVGRPG
ncbi:hypothetical protein [Sinomonas atrocyanea]